MTVMTVMTTSAAMMSPMAFFSILLVLSVMPSPVVVIIIIIVMTRSPRAWRPRARVAPAGAMSVSIFAASTFVDVVSSPMSAMPVS